MSHPSFETAQLAAQKSAFTPDESCYKTNFLADISTPSVNNHSETTAEMAQLKAENSLLAEQLAAAQDQYAQQKHETESYKKRLEEIKRKLEVAHRKHCQYVTSQDTPCTRVAQKAIQANHLIFWICKQHLKHYPDAKEL